MIPKVGQLLRWYDNFVLRDRNPNHDVGIVKEVQFDHAAYEYVVVVDWCKGPHHSLHDEEDWEESIRTHEIVVV